MTVTPGCCEADADCPQDEQCVDHYCDLDDNTCKSREIDPCIPTMSQWGLIAMTLLLLAVAKVYFGRRRIETV
jgi:hypothetical protein